MKISQLPHEIRKKALEYICEDNLALAKFQWEDTPEGYDYWQKWHEKLTPSEERVKRRYARADEINRIIDVVANHFGITTDELKYSKWKQIYVKPRMISQWLMLEDFAPIEIYTQFNNDDMGFKRNIKSMQRYLATDGKLRNELLIIMEKL